VAEGVRRREARRAMLELEVMCAVMATLSKGGTPVNALYKKLREQSGE